MQTRYTGRFVRIDAPDWFAREDFLAWLDDPAQVIATWHRKGERPVSEYADVFVTVDGEEGSNSDMPEDIWQAIVKACEDEDMREGLVWIANVRGVEGE